MPIQLIIKSPNQQVDDIKVECQSSWAIENLKEHLCTAYPTKPTKSQQKIIYGGRLLPDHLLLKDVITRDQDAYIMHLVCPQSTLSSKSNIEAAKVIKEEEPPANLAQPPLPNFLGNPIDADGLRQRGFDPQQYISNINSFYSQAQLPQANMMPMTSMYNAYQMATLQQTYAQFVAQCFAQGQPAYIVPNPNLTLNQPPGVTVPNVPNPQPNQPAVNERRLNANEGEDRFDVLDLMHFVIRVVMLFAVLYFYSTPGRIVLVLGLGIFLCLYKIGLGRRQPEPNVPANVPEQRNPNPRPESDISANSSAERQTDQSDGQSENSSGSESPLQEEQPVPEATLNGPSKLETAFVFVKTLFTSLIPDLPLPVDVN